MCLFLSDAVIQAITCCLPLPDVYTRLWIILAGSLVAVAAYSGQVTTVRASTALGASRSRSIPFLLQPSKLDGSLAGDEGFDPLGLSELDDALGLDLYWMREAELKHCRVAMLATVGFVGQELGVVLPGMVCSRKLFLNRWHGY